jgi:hypothetical protein
VPPVGAVPQVFAWCDVDGAVAPTTGERCFRALPYLHAEHFHILIDLFAQAFPDRLTRLRLDPRGAHTAQRLTLPANGGLVGWPPDGPERHPMARVGRDLNDARAGRQLPTLEVPQDAVATLLRGDEAATLQALTSAPDLVEAIHALRL